MVERGFIDRQSFGIHGVFGIGLILFEVLFVLSGRVSRVGPYLPKMNGWLGRDILGFETYRGNS